MSWRITHLVFLAVALLWPDSSRAFDPFSRLLEAVEEGNRLYEEQHFDEALQSYDAAEQRISNKPRIHFNRGNALFKLGKPKEAREAYLRAMGSKEPDFKKKNYYNIGNTFLAEGAFKDAISYYRRALEIDAEFDDARFNLEVALRAIEQQKQNQKSNSGQKKDDQGEEQQQKDEGDKDQQEEGDQKKDDEQQEGDEQKQDEKDEQQEDQEKDDQNEEQQDEKQDDGSKDDQQEQDKKGQQQQQDEKEQQNQQQQADQQKEGQSDKEGKQDKQPQESSPSRSERQPGRLSPAQVEALLEAMRENEKPFQMHKFVLPKYKNKQIEKDW